MSIFTKGPICGVLLAALCCAVAPAWADPPYEGGRGQHHEGDRNHGAPPPGYVRDEHYHHNYYYPPHGHVVPLPPHGYRTVHYYGSPYYYYGGAWYRPYGPSYMVVAPPFGMSVSFLPDYYTTHWFGGVPYYYADNVYYVRRPADGTYVVTGKPAGEPERVQSAPAPAGEDFFLYPNNGQSAEQQSRDRYECHRWAVSQTGFDPTQSQGGVSESQVDTKRSDYMRAISACLEGRGYTVK